MPKSPQLRRLTAEVIVVLSCTVLCGGVDLNNLPKKPHKLALKTWPEYHTYELLDGKWVQCTGSKKEHCGIHLYGCLDSRLYTCQPKAKDLGSVDVN